MPKRREVHSTWNYAEQANYYQYRPNYAERAITALVKHVGARAHARYLVADVGAGTGNLTILLLKRGLHCIAIEPTPEMRTIGVRETAHFPVEWKGGTGEHTGLEDSSINWFTMGSSFNTTDRDRTLAEAQRVLKRGGYFTCMWNHRDIDRDPIQRRVEEIIESIVPQYVRGVRREGQADYLLASKKFNDVHYIEESQRVARTLDDYLSAWKSVKNAYWDFHTKKGRATFDEIERRIRKEFSKHPKLHLVYTTKIWTARATP